MRIKIDKLDKLFSQYIKLRDKVCQRCGRYAGRLQTSHFWGRARKSVRWDEDNSCLLCFGCHQYFHSHPFEHVEWFKNRLGELEFDLLQARMKLLGKLDKEMLTLYYKEKLKEWGIH